MAKNFIIGAKNILWAGFLFDKFFIACIFLLLFKDGEHIDKKLKQFFIDELKFSHNKLPYCFGLWIRSKTVA